MSGYMPEYVFEAGAYTIAMLHISREVPIGNLACELYKSYERSYLDDGLVAQWIEAAKAALELVDKQFPDLDSEAKASTLKHLQTIVMKYHPDGRKRKKGLFSGTWFNKQPNSNFHRTEDLTLNYVRYYALFVTGKIE